MPLRVNTNISAFNSKRILGNNTKDLSLRIERLSSGLKVNRAADDAAGLSVSEGLRSEISGFLQGIRNSEQATNLIQTAESALNEVNAILIRIRELAVQSSSTTVNNQNRESVNAEFVQLSNEIDRIAQVTSYNNTSLLTGFGNAVSSDVTASVSGSQAAISNIDIAIQEVVRTRGGLGAIQNRLGTNIRANSVMAENDRASDSTIRDADVAREVSALARSQILSQSGLSVFAQANVQVASVLTLLQ